MLVSKSFLIAGAVAVAGIVSGALSTPRDSTKTEARAEGSIVPVFAARWDTTGMQQVVLKKQDRLDLVPLPVMAQEPPPEQDVEPPRETIVADVATNDDEVVRRPRKHHALNLCERHGMRKIITRGGRSWRCRR
jgi:hypothetical protein